MAQAPTHPMLAADPHRRPARRQPERSGEARRGSSSVHSSAVGLIHGAASLGVLAWAHDHHGTAITRTMAMTTFALTSVFLSLAARDETKSVFSLDVLEDRLLVRTTGISLVLIFMAAQLGALQRILHTKSLKLQRVADLHRRGALDHRRGGGTPPRARLWVTMARQRGSSLATVRSSDAFCGVHEWRLLERSGPGRTELAHPRRSP